MALRLAAFDLDGTLLRGQTACEAIAKGIGRIDVDDQDLYTIVITTYIPPRQVGDGPWTPWYADYYHPAV